VINQAIYLDLVTNLFFSTGGSALAGLNLSIRVHQHRGLL